MARPSYVHGTSKLPLLGETIGENLRRTVERFPGRDALVVRGGNERSYRATYAELWEATGEVARGLMALGVEPGDRVGIWSPNRHEWVLAQYATARIGAILVNINPAYKTAELQYVLRQSGASVLLLARRFRQSDYAAMLAEVRDRCPDLGAALVLDDDWGTLLDAGRGITPDDLDRRERALQFDDPINIQYTSGTTGFPKGATLSHHNVLNNGYFVGETLKLTEADRVCIPVPFYHCFGMVLGNLACTTHGAAMIIPGEAYEPRLVLEAVAAEKCTALYGVPTMFIGELELADFDAFDLSTLRTGIMAGSPCPVEVMRSVIARMNMREVTICYGMTETSPVSTQSATDDPLEKRVGTVGRVHPHVEVKIVDAATGAIVPRGERGELCTRGYSVMLGYWNNEEATPYVPDLNTSRTNSLMPARPGNRGAAWMAVGKRDIRSARELAISMVASTNRGLRSKSKEEDASRGQSSRRPATPDRGHSAPSSGSLAACLIRAPEDVTSCGRALSTDTAR